MSLCPALSPDVGVIRDILGSVDCNVQLYSAAGYLALTGPASPLPAALTALLTIYVALLGYRMLFAVGGARLADTPLIAVKIGVILTLTLNWSVFQTLVFNLDANAPLQIGRVISRPMAAGGPSLATDLVDGLQTAYDELTADAAELAKKAAGQGMVVGPGVQPPQGDETAAAADLRRAAGVLVGSTAGVMAMAFIATGVLTAVGPVFIALFLFSATRGFFVGWLRALTAATLAPMVCWIATSLLLVVLAPRIEVLAQQRAAHQISLDAAVSACAMVLIFAAAQGALLVGVVLTAAGFRLSSRAAVRDLAPQAGRDIQIAAPILEARTRGQILAANLQRSPASYSREFSASSATIALSRDDAAGAAADDGPARPQRLGETYRRGAAMRNRGRLGAAGRA